MREGDIGWFEIKNLGYGITLERVMNAAGVPYSTICFNGNEYLCQETEKEEELLAYWHEHKDEYLELWSKRFDKNI